MEKVHNPSRRVWIDDKVVNVRKFLKEWHDKLSPLDPAVDVNRLERRLPQGEFHKIENNCSPELLRCDYQERVEPDDHLDIPEGVKLNTLEFQKEDLEKRKRDRKYANAHYVAMKYTNYPPHKTLKVDLDKLEPKEVDQPDVVLTVQIHTPERKPNPKVVNYVKMPSFHADQEFLVLGCQYLTELREMIDCISDKAIPGEYSDCPNSLPSVTCKDIYKSGFFYINGVFYNDMRDKDCRDYSESIIKWSKNRGIGPFDKARMEQTRFVDLTLTLGYPYVYVHQGECEHIIVFTDLRLFTKHDLNNRNAYPLYTAVKPSKRIFCMVCHNFTATWVVLDNKRLPENPYFFCKHCFLSFNYDENNQKIGEFRAYYFPDRTRLF